MRTRGLLAFGWVAAGQLVVVSLVDGAVRAGYDPYRNWVSQLQLGPRGWLGTADLALTGAWLLLHLPSTTFDRVVPVLVALAAALVAVQPFIDRALARRREHSPDAPVGRGRLAGIVLHTTYEEGDQYDASAAQGFIKIHGLSQTTQAKHQMLKGPGGRGHLELPSIIPPDTTGN